MNNLTEHDQLDLKCTTALMELISQYGGKIQLVKHVEHCLH